LAAKPPLPHPRLDDGFGFSLGNLGVLPNVDFDPVLLLLKVRFPRWAQPLRTIDFFRDIRKALGHETVYAAAMKL
jgi:hypothetical protein